MKTKTVPSNILESIQTVTLKYKKIKLIMEPNKLKYIHDNDYGSNISTTKYAASIPECKYNTSDIPVLNTFIKIKNVCNKMKDPYDALFMIFSIYGKNCDKFKLSIVPYPDDVSLDRSKEIKHLL